MVKIIIRFGVRVWYLFRKVAVRDKGMHNVSGCPHNESYTDECVCLTDRGKDLLLSLMLCSLGRHSATGTLFLLPPPQQATKL